MIIVFYLIIVFLLLLDYLKYKNICSPIFIFCGIWILICTFALLGLYDFKSYSHTVIKIVLCGVICFALGNFFVGGINVGKQAGPTLNSRESLGLNMYLLNFILLLVCIGSILSLYYSFRAFLSGMTYLEVRGSLLKYNDKQIISNSFVSSFINYFCGPAKTVLLPMAIIFLFNKTHRRFCLIAFLCAFAGVVSSGGRITILYTVVQLVAAVVYYGIQISKKVKRNIRKAVVVMIGALIVLTNLRTSSGIWFSVYAYFSVPVALLSEFIEIADSTHFYAYGGATLYPFLYIANVVTDTLGMNIKYLNDLIYYVGLPQEKWIELFPGRVYNAFCSLFYFFYLDFRTVGIAIFSFIYGIITGVAYKRAYCYKNQKYFLWYLMLLQTMFGSFIIWQLGNTKFFVSVLILLTASIKIKTSHV